jgi:hypothetical protein
MTMPSSRFPPGFESAWVWRQLDVDLRQQAISVVARMAFNLLKTQVVSSQQEGDDDDHSTAFEQATQ